MGIKQVKFWILIVNILIWGVALFLISRTIYKTYNLYEKKNKHEYLYSYLNNVKLSYNNTFLENVVIQDSKDNIIEYIKQSNRSNKDYFIDEINKIRVIGCDEEKYYNDSSVASYIVSDKSDLIIFNRKYSSESIYAFTNTIQHELIHKLEAIGFFCEVSPILIENIYDLSNIDNIKNSHKHIENLFSTPDITIDEYTTSLIYKMVDPDKMDYFSSKSETLSRLVNMKIFLYKEGIIDSYNDELTACDIRYSFIVPIAKYNCVTIDYLSTILLLDFDKSTETETIKNINLILK